jgi:uncharacterized integral membrane protein
LIISHERHGGMKSLIKALVLLPFVVIFLVFAVSNRAEVSVVLDPLGLAGAWAQVSMPLFMVMSMAALVGVLIGGFGAWWGGRKWREQARQLERETLDLRQEIDRLRRKPEDSSSLSMMN